MPGFARSFVDCFVLNTVIRACVPWQVARIGWVLRSERQRMSMSWS